jgi:hypothetical protein
MPVTAGPIYPGVKDGLVFAIDPANPKSWTGPTSVTVNSLVSYNFTTGSIFNDPSGSYGVNESFTFDGVNDYINFGNPSELQITGALSISCWFKSEDLGTYRRIVSKDSNGATGRSYVLQLQNNGAIVGAIFNSNSSINFTGATGYDDNQWHNAVFVFDPGNELAVYVDTDKESTSTSVTTIDNDPCDLRIGLRGDNAHDFNGQIGPVLIYNRALSAGEVLQNYNRLKGRFGLS